MTDSGTLQIATGTPFKEVPEHVTVAFALRRPEDLALPGQLCDPEAPVVETGAPGAYTPLIVRAAEQGYRIVDGCVRYREQVQAGNDSIACFILHTPLDDFASGLLRLCLNRNREKTVAEKGRILEWLRLCCDAETAASYARHAGLSPKDIEMISSLLSCDALVRNAVYRGAIDISLLTLLLALTPDDRIAFLTTFGNLRLSFQTQREFLEWLPEIAWNEENTVRDILSAPSLINLLTDAAGNTPQQVRKIHAYLFEKRFPRLSRAMAQWKSAAAALNPDPSSITFMPHPCFEKNRLEVKIAVTDPVRAAGLFKKLAAITSGQWQSLIYPVDDTLHGTFDTEYEQP